MDEAGNTIDLRERELSKIEQIFYPTEPNVILEGFSEAASAILFRADVIKSGKRRKNKTPEREIRFSMLQYLAENASNNLVCLFFIKRKRFVQYLIIYNSKDDAERSLFELGGKNISTKFGPTQMHSELVTNAFEMRCLTPPVADCYQFMLKRLQVLNLPGRPIPKRFLRPIFCQRKRDIICCKKATLTSLPANDITGLLESGDDEPFSDSAMSSESSRTDSSSDHRSPRTICNSPEPIRAVEDRPVDVRSDHSPNAELAIDQVPTQTTILQLNHEERTLQLRYWGLSKDTDTARCNVCALEGHVSQHCPSLKCPKCYASHQHSSDACPTYRICTKCREHGHRKENCPAKLARTTADGFICHRCKQKGHIEETCSSLWRSYDPSTDLDIVKVDNLLVSCYQCGLNDHWGDDCKVIPKRKTIINTNNVFSAKSANVYLLKPMESAINTRSSIKSSDKTNYSSEEGDQNSFYRNKKPKQANFGTIKIRTAGTTSKITSQTNSKYQSPANSERRNLTTKRHQPYPSYSSHTHTYQPKYRQGLPVDTYWRSGSGWQPPLPSEPLPSSSSKQEMPLHNSYDGQHQSSDKQQRAKQYRYSYSSNYKNY